MDQKIIKELILLLENLNIKKQMVNDEINHIYTEFKNSGLSKNIIQKVLKFRKQDMNKIIQEEEIVKNILNFMG